MAALPPCAEHAALLQRLLDEPHDDWRFSPDEANLVRYSLCALPRLQQLHEEWQKTNARHIRRGRILLHLQGCSAAVFAAAYALLFISTGETAAGITLGLWCAVALRVWYDQWRDAPKSKER